MKTISSSSVSPGTMPAPLKANYAGDAAEQPHPRRSSGSSSTWAAERISHCESRYKRNPNGDPLVLAEMGRLLCRCGTTAIPGQYICQCAGNLAVGHVDIDTGRIGTVSQIEPRMIAKSD
jgi:hypothetical protein